MFELPLLGYIAAPDITRYAIESIDASIREHRRQGLLLGSALAGGYLIVGGIVSLKS